jgi:hypothetical protein
VHDDGKHFEFLMLEGPLGRSEMVHRGQQTGRLGKDRAFF